MTIQTQDGVKTKAPHFAPGCGYTCPYRDMLSRTCERHGPTEADLIVERVTKAFSEEIRTIMRDNRDEGR